MNEAVENVSLLRQNRQLFTATSSHYFSICFDGEGLNSYGERQLYTSAGATKSTSSTGNPYWYTGRHLDTETGLHYFRARYFDDEMGRFIGRDPIGYHDGMNLYAGYFVPNGLDWSGMFQVSDHKSITGDAFDLAIVDVIEPEPLPTDECKNHMREALKEGNGDTDSPLGDFWSLRKHFNRGPFTSKESANQSYLSYLNETEEQFNNELRQKKCNQALGTLGTLSHSWQDFYAHAVKYQTTTQNTNDRAHQSNPNTVSVPNFNIWSEGGGGDPYNHTDIWPSTYLIIPTGTGEHPAWWEPTSGEEFDMRKSAAIDFTASMFSSMLQGWWETCHCECGDDEQSSN